MSIGSPDTAIPRTDLPYLRHRGRPPIPGTAPEIRTDQHPRRAAPPAMPSMHRPPRTKTDAFTVLTPAQPTVVLNRLQSGIGTLAINAVWITPSMPTLGTITQLRSGRTIVVATNQMPAKTDPATLTDRRDYQRITLDLLRSRWLERMIVLAIMRSPLASDWEGKLVLTTAAQARIEVPIRGPLAPGATVLMSIYNIDGELVLRAEPPTGAASPRDAAASFGFDQIVGWTNAE